MDYFKRIVLALVPRKMAEIVIVALFVPAVSWAGVSMFLSEPPAVNIHTETTYPPQAHRNGFFYLNFDVSFSKACFVKARRYIIGSDGFEYLAQEDSKEVKQGERMKYVVRVDIRPSIPLGPAFIRSDFEYGCDFWSRNFMSIKREGRLRPVEILPALTLSGFSRMNDCALPEEPGMTTVKAHYRRKPGFITAKLD